MKFTSRIELSEGMLLKYFVDQWGRKQGTLQAYSITVPELIREEFLLYSQDFKDDLPVGVRTSYKLNEKILTTATGKINFE
jgi:hypothetical protein